MTAELRSVASIASAAMIWLGRDPIADLGDVHDVDARMVASRYDAVRDALLRSYPWNFAMRMASLPGRALAAPAFGYTHACALPSGGDMGYCVKLWRADVARDVKWIVQGREMLLTCAPPVSVNYVIRQTDVEQYDPIFAEMLAIDLALALINRVGSNDIRKSSRELMAERRRLKREATLHDAIESYPRDPTDGDRGSWIRARRVL